MKTYLVRDINKKYTDCIRDYMDKGYIIHTNTMGGSQGEKACVHLMAPDRKTVLRVSLDRFSNWNDDTEGHEINVRQYSTDKLRQINDLSSMNDILWESKGEIIDNIKFYQISSSDYTFFGDKEAFTEAKKKHVERLRKHDDTSSIKYVDLTSDKAINAVYPWVKRQYKCTSVLKKDIESVMKCVTVQKNKKTSKIEYKVSYKINLKNKYLSFPVSR